MRHTGLALFLLLLPFQVSAQPSFLEVTPLSNPYFATPPEEDFWVNAVAPADADGDGDVDLAVLGYYVVYNQSAEDRLLLFRNDGAGGDGRWTFSTTEVPLGALFAGSSDLAWGDIDNDGDHDLAVGSEGATALYRNDGGALSPLNATLPGYSEDSSYSGAYDLRSLTWADADNDGDQDLLVPSVWDPDTFSYSTHLMRNDGADGAGGWTFTDLAAGLDPTAHAQSAWADDDGDGDLDLLLVNVDPYTKTGFIRRFGNEAAAFTGTPVVDVRVEYGLADWGDYDSDGDFDILVAGNLQEGDGSFTTALRLYRNDGGSYTATDLATSPSVNWLDFHAATWADYDSDGDMDLLATGNYVGEGEIVGHSKIFTNDGGVFTELALELPAPISSIGAGGAFTWFDLEGDGDLDYFVAGAYYVPGGNGLVASEMHLFRNGTPAANASPSAVSHLTAVPGAAGTVALSWSPATDDHTPASALTYDLQVRRTGTSAASAERLPEVGNISTATNWTLADLPPGSYTYEVCAVDSAFNGGPKTQGTFIITGGALIFADGFETGGTGAWSVVVP